MKIPVLIEPVPGNGFRATGGGPFSLSAEGATQADALRHLNDLIRSRIPEGSVVVPLDLGAAEHTWLPFAGMFENHPLFDEWQQAIQEAHFLDDSGTAP